MHEIHFPGRCGDEAFHRAECAIDRLAAPATGSTGVTAPVRLDRRTKNLTKRLQPGDIAVIDHVDIDRVSAEALVALPGRRRRQRRAEHLRPLPQPRAARS